MLSSQLAIFTFSQNMGIQVTKCWGIDLWKKSSLDSQIKKLCVEELKFVISWEIVVFMGALEFFWKFRRQHTKFSLDLYGRYLPVLEHTFQVNSLLQPFRSYLTLKEGVQDLTWASLKFNCEAIVGVRWLIVAPLERGRNLVYAKMAEADGLARKFKKKNIFESILFLNFKSR